MAHKTLLRHLLCRKAGERVSQGNNFLGLVSYFQLPFINHKHLNFSKNYAPVFIDVISSFMFHQRAISCVKKEDGTDDVSLMECLWTGSVCWILLFSQEKKTHKISEYI